MQPSEPQHRRDARGRAQPLADPPNPSATLSSFPPLSPSLCTLQHFRSPAKAICSPVRVMSVSVLSPPGQCTGGGGTAGRRWHRVFPSPDTTVVQPSVRFGVAKLTPAHLHNCRHARVCACSHAAAGVQAAHPSALARSCTTARVPVSQAGAGLLVALLARTRVVLSAVRSCACTAALARPHARSSVRSSCGPTCFRACTSARRRNRPLHGHPGTSASPPAREPRLPRGDAAGSAGTRESPPNGAWSSPKELKEARGKPVPPRPHWFPIPGTSFARHPRHPVGRGGVTSGAGAQRVLAPPGPGPW